MIDWRGIGDLGAASQLLSSMQAARLLQPQQAQVPENKRVLILAPHPDDEIIGMGGALLQMIAKGCTVKVVYFTSDSSDVEAEEIDQVAAAAGFSYERLNFPMRDIPLNPESLKGLADIVKDFAPEAFFLPFMLDDHIDHRDTSFALLEIEGILPAAEVWTYQVYSTLSLNAVVNIGDVMERKIAILHLYQSRFKPRDWAHYTRGMNAMNTRFLTKPGAEDYAEIYYKTDVKSYLQSCRSYRESLNTDHDR